MAVKTHVFVVHMQSMNVQDARSRGTAQRNVSLKIGAHMNITAAAREAAEGKSGG